MKVRQLINYLEKIPVDQQELLEMEMKIKVPSATGQLTQWVGITDARIVTDDRKQRTAVELTTTFAV